MIVSTQEQPETALDDDQERWPIETLFGCLKTRGVDLAATHMTDPQQLEKLLAVAALAFSRAPLIGEGRPEVKPINIKKQERPAQRFFR